MSAKTNKKLASPEVVEKRKQKIEQVETQYEERIIILLSGRNSEDLAGKDKEAYDKLIRCSMYDPRRPDVGFETKEMVYKGFEIADKLDRLTDEEFMTNSYVLEWIDEIGDGMKITNLPIDEDLS